MREDATPWAWFLPVMLAVLVGMLGAQGIGHALKSVFDPPEAQRARATVAVAAPAAAAPAPEVAVESLPAIAPTRAVAEPGAPGADGAADPSPEPAVPDAATAVSQGGPAAAAGVAGPDLPGPMTAMRDSAPEACINGTVAERRPNGWEQALEADRPLRCNATSP